MHVDDLRCELWFRSTPGKASGGAFPDVRHAVGHDMLELRGLEGGRKDGILHLFDAQEKTVSSRS
jgi:hypothetical protein